MSKEELLQSVARILNDIKLSHPVRVAIDGIDGSGKTTFADALVPFLNKNVIRVSIDGFHNPKEIRYQKGRESPEGYYYDSFDNEALINNLLKPLSTKGDLNYKTSIFDYKKDEKVVLPYEIATLDSILLFDGIFLLRPELIDYWDYKIFLDVEFSTILERVKERDKDYLGSVDEVIEKYQKRYIPGQKLYFEESRPLENADLVIDNSNFDNPFIEKNNTG